MKENIIYELKTLYRDNFRVRGYEFGEGENSVCIVGSMRGNEVQQTYVCGKLVHELKMLEEKGAIKDGKKILVIPCVNPRSINTEKRFWPIDNTDINRMFPGYDLGETTQRIAAGLFEKIKGFEYGIQFASFYMPGRFIPHVRMMSTGNEDVEQAKLFGLPYVVRRKIKPYDTTTLNYNWQIWGTKAYSVYTATTSSIDEESARQGVKGVLNFLKNIGVIDAETYAGYHSKVVWDTDMISVRTAFSGIYKQIIQAGQQAEVGDVVAQIIDPYTSDVLKKIVAPCEGMVFFSHNNPLVYTDTAVVKIVPDR